jgi:two-component system, NtrC family, sensor histidine kinase HydH
MRGASIAAVSGGLCYGALVASLAQHWLRPPPDQPSALYLSSSEELSFYVTVNLLVLVVVMLLAGTLADRLRWTGGELIAATERAEQAERMAALGRLAAGLAHEIRNPLGSIAGSVQLLRSGRGMSEEDQKLCEIIQSEASRLNDLVTDMVDLSRPRKPELAVVDAATVARDVVALASKSGRGVSDVDVRFEGEVTPLLIRADGAQLRQLIWNLVRNAVQASEAGELVTVSVRHEADGVALSVVDRGVGIDPAQMPRLFDAFFTTRSQGSGVGLAVVKRIADEHGFVIHVTSQAGRGATFRVLMGQPISA